MFSVKKMKVCSLALSAVVILSALAGCGKQQAQQPGGAVPVKAMQVVQRDTPVIYEYAGQVKAKDEVAIQARISGNIVEKYVNGGDYVHRGQALYKIDPRTYSSAVNSAQASLAQSQANLSNASLVRSRYEKLVANNALDVQTLTTQQSTEEQYAAVVEANRAALQKAQDDLADTVIVAPVDGRIGVGELSVGTYVAAGSTAMATISSGDPIFVQFTMNESEYLKMASLAQSGTASMWGENVGLTLADGSTYSEMGRVEQVDRMLNNNTGALTFNAAFANPNNLLIPGMFARLKLTGEIVPNAMLVPQRAVQQLLEKSFVMVVDGENKAQAKEIKLGTKVGSYYIVESGIDADDKIIVEGLTKIQSGVPLNVTDTTPEELQLSFE